MQCSTVGRDLLTVYILCIAKCAVKGWFRLVRVFGSEVLANTVCRVDMWKSWSATAVVAVVLPVKSCV